MRYFSLSFRINTDSISSKLIIIQGNVFVFQEIILRNSCEPVVLRVGTLNTFREIGHNFIFYK